MPDTKVYVADAGSTDSTRDIALSYLGRLDIAVIPGGLPSVGRNAGARLADSSYVLFLDADVELPDPAQVRRAVTAMRRRKLFCVTTSIVCRDGSLTDKFLYATNNVMQRIGTWMKPFGTGMFLLFDKEEFDRLGGFNERALFAEDYLLTKKISPLRFGIIRGHILTTNRRFRKMGHSQMIWLYFKTMMNSWNDSYFLRDQEYWDKTHTQENQ